MKNKAVIFDLDGTLLNTLEDIMIVTNKILARKNYKKYNLDSYRDFVGSGVKKLIERAAPESSIEEINAFVGSFKDLYKNHWKDNTFVYKGINEVLQKLNENDVKLFILSNKSHIFVREMVEFFFPKGLFSDIWGHYENYPLKPNPKSVNKIIEKNNLEKLNTFFIGDTNIDIETAKNAEISSIGVLWGFRNGKSLKKADYIVKHPNEILKIVQENEKK